MSEPKYRWPCGRPMSEPEPWEAAKPYLRQSMWLTLPNGQEVFDWDRARYNAWREQIDWIDRVSRGEGCA